MSKPLVCLVGHNVHDLHPLFESVRALGCEVNKLEHSCSKTPEVLTKDSFKVLIIEADKFFPLGGADQLFLKQLRSAKPSLPIIMLCPSGMCEGSHQEVVTELGLKVVHQDRYSVYETATRLGEAVIDCI